jgi:hypothetical protein
MITSEMPGLSRDVLIPFLANLDQQELTARVQAESELLELKAKLRTRTYLVGMACLVVGGLLGYATEPPNFDLNWNLHKTKYPTTHTFVFSLVLGLGCGSAARLMEELQVNTEGTHRVQMRTKGQIYSIEKELLREGLTPLEQLQLNFAKTQMEDSLPKLLGRVKVG